MTDDAPMITTDGTGEALAPHPAGASTLGSVATRSAATRSVPDPLAPPAITLEHVTVSFGRQCAVRNVTLELPTRQVTAFVGPSGCGKTTLLRAINRLHDQTGGRVQGSIHVGGLDVYGAGIRPELVRGRIGMVFQRPNPFPTMSIFDNVVAGLRLNGIRKKSLLREAAEVALHHAALWDSVKDQLREPAIRLSGGQQQRLCIARALAVEPEVLLMDEPCSALDPIATAKIEDFITALSPEITIVLVTHNMFQAARVAERVAIFLLGDDRVGELAETGPTAEVFTSPFDPRTKAYVEGRVG